MRIRRRALAVAAALLAQGFALAPGARAEETILFYERLTQTVALRPAKEGGNVVTDTSRTETMVALGDHRLAVYEPLQVSLYDFGRRRVLTVSTRHGTYSDWSLYALVAFKEMELEDRLALRRRIRAAHPGQAPSVLELESLFSIAAGTPQAAKGESFADSSSAGRVRVLINRRMVLEAFPTDTAFAPGRAEMFDRFLAFQAHLHPNARRALLRSGKVPRQIVYRYRDFNNETVVMLRLFRVSSAPEGNDPTANSDRVDVDDPDYRELNARLAACRQCATRGDWIGASRRFEATALDSGHYVDAALARAERVLGACEPDSTWPAALEQRARGDSAIGALRLGMVWRDSAGAAAALRRLDRVNGERLEKGYVLDYLRARARFAVSDFETAAYLMMGGLGGNPCMAGGWLDLAHGYLKAFQPVLAWICLEAAEQTGGGDGCAARLNERTTRERELEKRHPELFD